MVDAAMDGPGQAVTVTPTPISAVPAPAPESGRIGGFTLISQLGHGGMGTVWLARQESVGREVALKLLDPALARDQGFTVRFMREAKAMGIINHPQVVSCYDAGVDQGRFFLALELVPGGDACRYARRQGGRLPIAEVLAIGLDCARGLEAIHAAGLIHRDIKPANIFLTAPPSGGGRAKLGDLGLVRPSAGEPRMTHTGAALGTPAYMAPEQARGDKAIDIRADIYALGATLFELATGEPPYQGETAYAVVSQVLAGPVPDPRRLNPAISAALAAVILRAMARHPDARFSSPQELREDLERLAVGELPLAFSRALGGNLATGMLTRGAPAPGTGKHEARPVVERPRPRSRPWLVPGILVGAAMLLAVVVAIGPGSGHAAMVDAPAAASDPAAPPAATPSSWPGPTPAAVNPLSERTSAADALARPAPAPAPHAEALPAPAALTPLPATALSAALPRPTTPAAATAPTPSPSAAPAGGLPLPVPAPATAAGLPTPPSTATLPVPPSSTTAAGLPPPPSGSAASSGGALDSPPPPATVPAR